MQPAGGGFVTGGHDVVAVHSSMIVLVMSGGVDDVVVDVNVVTLVVQG